MELFKRAKEARRAGELEGARSLFEQLREVHPRSPHARTALVSLARLELEGIGDARAALGHFDAYLALGRDTPLHEEALVGKATALARLGRSAEELGAWEQLLADHPDSPQIPRARERIDALATRP
jgi:outer membrane protein assembly factor BamD (BamD/ComL family)